MTSRLFAVLVTFQRPDDLDEHLGVLRKQTRSPDELVVVDNAPSTTNEALVATYAEHAPVEYVASETNSGAAGGIARGLRAVLPRANDDDWIVLFDDDNPPRSDEVLEQLWDFAQREGTDLAVGAVGLTGARFDVRRARLQRLADSELHGVIDVDFVGGNQFPMLRVAAVRDVGVFRDELFWGLDDLDYGLRLRAAGFRILVSGELMRGARAFHGRLGIEPSTGAVGVTRRPWRQYYTVRNLIDILRRNNQSGAAARVAVSRGLGKAAVHALRHPSSGVGGLRLSLRAIDDGWRGRLGRTVEPIG